MGSDVTSEWSDSSRGSQGRASEWSDSSMGSQGAGGGPMDISVEVLEELLVPQPGELGVAAVPVVNVE